MTDAAHYPHGLRWLDRVLAALLVTDIVDSTAHALELSNGRWRDLLARHDQAVRAVLDRFRGREVPTTGDGFVPVFDGAERAIHAAEEIGQVASGIGLGSGPRSTPARSSARASGGLADQLH